MKKIKKIALGLSIMTAMSVGNVTSNITAEAASTFQQRIESIMNNEEQVNLVFYLDRPNYFLAKFVSVLTVIIVIPTIFYGYKSILKKVDNILIYFILFNLIKVLSVLTGSSLSISSSGESS